MHLLFMHLRDKICRKGMVCVTDGTPGRLPVPHCAVFPYVALQSL